MGVVGGVLVYVYLKGGKHGERIKWHGIDRKASRSNSLFLIPADNKCFAG